MTRVHKIVRVRRMGGKGKLGSAAGRQIAEPRLFRQLAGPRHDRAVGSLGIGRREPGLDRSRSGSKLG